MPAGFTARLPELIGGAGAADETEMLVDQQKAEDEKKRSEQLQKELSEQLQQIAAKKTEVQKDLSQVGEKE